MPLAAARDDQFLVEQDLHEAAAPIDGLLRNRDHRVPEHTVAVGHRVTIFVPEPKAADHRVPVGGLLRSVSAFRLGLTGASLAAEYRAFHEALEVLARVLAGEVDVAFLHSFVA